MNTSALETTRKIARKPILALIAAGLALASCKTSNLGIDELGTPPNGAPVLSANPSGEVVGQGTTRIALLIPKNSSRQCIQSCCRNSQRRPVGIAGFWTKTLFN